MNDQIETVPKRRERSDARENRRQLLAVAKQLFTAQGIDTTSMHEIGRTAGVGQATLYRHFADKGEICHALIKEDLAAFQERVGALIDSAGAATSPLARLETLIIEKNRLTESHLPLFAAIDEAATAAKIASAANAASSGATWPWATAWPSRLVICSCSQV